MFLQQDLRLTTSQLNEYMKTEITKSSRKSSLSTSSRLWTPSSWPSIRSKNQYGHRRAAAGHEPGSPVRDRGEKQQVIKRFEANMTGHY